MNLFLTLSTGVLAALAAIKPNRLGWAGGLFAVLAFGVVTMLRLIDATR